jgi:hypothetical protein
MDKMEKEIGEEWQIMNLGEPQKIVGIKITLKECMVTISQQKYIEAILKKEGIEKLNPISMPMDPNIKLEPNPDGGEGNKSNSYARLIGELQFLLNATWPDITFAVNKLASYTMNPSLQHISTVKRVLHYLAGMKDYGITYTDSTTHPNIFHRYADAAYGRDSEDRRSTVGYIFMTENGVILWRSKKQSVITLSTTKAKYIALSKACCEICWLRGLYKELEFKQQTPILLWGDNEGAVAMTKDPQFHQQSKHINIKYQAIRDWAKNGIVCVENCRDQDCQTADILTKLLLRLKHKKHVLEMGIAPA